MLTGATKQQLILTRKALRPLLHEDEARLTELRHAKIARLAYYIWQIRGEPSGGAEVDWLIAEHVFQTGRFPGTHTGTC